MEAYSVFIDNDSKKEFENKMTINWNGLYMNKFLAAHEFVYAKNAD